MTLKFITLYLYIYIKTESVCAISLRQYVWYFSSYISLERKGCKTKYTDSPFVT